MQTFLPYSDFALSVKQLDNKRLGKQRVEAKQILNVIEGKTTSWANHPAVKMWVGYRDALCYYHDCCIIEWVSRGFKNTMLLREVTQPSVDMLPWWVGNEEFHRAMRARLIEKDEEFYLPKFPLDKGFNGGKYFWPVMETKSFRII